MSDEEIIVPDVPKIPNMEDLMLVLQGIKEGIINEVNVRFQKMEERIDAKVTPPRNPAPAAFFQEDQSFTQRLSSLGIRETEEEDDSFRRPNRRQSVFEQFAERVPTSQKNVFLMTPTMDYKTKLQLTSLNVNAISIFVTRFRMLEAETIGIDIKMGTLMSREVIQSLASFTMSFDPQKAHMLQLGAISFMENEALLKLLQRYIAPKDKGDFVQKMDNNLKFPQLPDNYKVSLINFEPMYVALLEYRFRFESLMDLLTGSSTPASAIPPLDYKKHPRGLITIFMDHIPDQIGVFIYDRIETADLKALKTMRQFLMLFAAQLQAIQLHSAETVRWQRTWQNLAGRTQDDSPVTRSYVTNPMKTPQRTWVPRQHNLISDQSPAEDFDEYVRESVMEETQDTFVEQLLAMEEAQLEESFAAALSTDEPTPTTPNGCWVMLFKGSCPKKGACRFSHDRAVLAETWKLYFQQLKQSPFNPQADLHQRGDNPPSTYNRAGNNPLSMTSRLSTPTIKRGPMSGGSGKVALMSASEAHDG
jgi:hypothetical protein